MTTRRWRWTSLACGLLAAGCSKPTPPAGSGGAVAGFTLESPSLSEGQPIARGFTCDGEDRSPALRWSVPPAGTRSFALIVDDPDAPSGVFTHHLLFGIDPARRELPAALAREGELQGIGRQGKNDFDKLGWSGPCPPPGKPHRYRFTLLALSAPIGLAAGATKQELEAASAGKVLARATLTATYARAR
jgi:hypothetical protein